MALPKYLGPFIRRGARSASPLLASPASLGSDFLLTVSYLPAHELHGLMETVSPSTHAGCTALMTHLIHDHGIHSHRSTQSRRTSRGANLIHVMD